MSSTFLGLNISLSGLYTSQRSLYVTNNNISNANTPGYSRQVTTQKSSIPMASCQGTGMIGTGSEIVSVDRVRNKYLDYKYWDENITLGEWEAKSSYLSKIEAVLGEPSDYGYNVVINDFYNSLEELSNDPSSGAARALVAQTGESVCEYFNTTANTLLVIQQDINSTIKTKIDEVNSLTEQITKLNEQIYKEELNGDHANELRDERDLLVDELSKLVDIEVSEVNVGILPNGNEDYHFQITLNGSYLINHFDSYDLECYEMNDGLSNDGMYGIRWENNGITVEMTGGQLKGYIDLRDGTGENGDYKGIPYYMKQLDKYAMVFAKSFNEGIFTDGSKYYDGHAGGIGLDGSTDIRFFTYEDMLSDEFMNSGGDIDSIYNNLTALNISVSLDIQNDVNKIAASSFEGGAENNENIDQLIRLCNDTKMFSEGSQWDFINSIIATLGTEAQHANRVLESQENIIMYINNNRLSISSVSIDEETINMVKYQQAYTAAAKMIQIWKEIYEITINELGR